MDSEQQVFRFEPKNEFSYIHWKDKQPYTSIQYCPALCKERFGEVENGWINRLYWGDNLLVMGHLLKEFRGKIHLIYIDPPFDSRNYFKKKIKIRNSKNDFSIIKEKLYNDVWPDDSYLQFMYQRLILLRELLSDNGSIYLHCDWHKSHYLRLIMDEIFGKENFRNEIVWCYNVNKGKFRNKFPPRHDSIFFYAKSNNNLFNHEAMRMEPSKAAIKRWGAYANKKNEVPYEKLTPGMKKVAGKGEKPYILRGGIQVDWITGIPGLNSGNSKEAEGYPTQKPEKLIELFINASSNPGDIVFDCFMGSGTTQAAAMKLGRRFIGVDNNHKAVQITKKRLLVLKKSIDMESVTGKKKCTGFGIYNLLMHDSSANRIKAEADIQRKGNKLVICKFYPVNLMQKLNLDRNSVSDWKNLVDSVMIDFNYNQPEMHPLVIDIPEKNKSIKGEYVIPKDSGRIMVRITDLIFESHEIELK
jgi:DNA modification methylase